MAGSSPESVAVVSVPFPAQGHLNQLLHLSLQLADRGLAVHYAAPATHVRQARERLQGWDDKAIQSIQFHDLGIPAYVSPPPDLTADTPFPSHFMPLWETYSAEARAPLSALLDKLSASHHRVVVVYDFLSSFAAEEAARLPNIEAFGFHCTAVSSFVGRLDAGHRLLRENDLHYLPTEVFVTKEFADYAHNRVRMAQTISSAAGILANTCRALEGDFIDAVAETLAAGRNKLFAVGPFNPVLDASASKQGRKRRHEYLDWLDKQPPASVLYISFGSMTSLREEQVTELAAALGRSKQRFIWVLRDADRGDIFTDSGGDTESRHVKLLSEFRKQTEGTGLLITGWAPQLEILAHNATAAFMSHCGWNSTMESLSHGKPILAWPMHSDQPWDAELICKYFKAGILVRPWEKHDEVVPATTIQELIGKLLVSDEGSALRQRAKELGEAVRSSAAAGGPSREELERFVAHVTR
ncbi:hypothetical protein GUJ93_ZPchr2177g28972 [Zizania palustris]|uniref:Glycosyltransferase n=1 Tax=Zizania palustris TaxID=103762 RepID=A0A8J5V0E1_ZIZPA|nr:hypothetical protein GUJ93_ZPchr2177g28972 [Zizania palustris]